jgi:hypothetical protein
VLFARIIQLSWAGARVSALTARLGCAALTVRRCVHRLNTQGLPEFVVRPIKPIATVAVVDHYL